MSSRCGLAAKSSLMAARLVFAGPGGFAASVGIGWSSALLMCSSVSSGAQRMRFGGRGAANPSPAAARMPGATWCPACLLTMRGATPPGGTGAAKSCGGYLSTMPLTPLSTSPGALVHVGSNVMSRWLILSWFAMSLK